MAATPPLQSSSSLINPCALSNNNKFSTLPSLLQIKTAISQITNIRIRRDAAQNWNSAAAINHHLHPIQNSSPSPSSISAASEPSPSKNAKHVCLSYCAETKALAERVAAQSDAFELRSISWRAFDDGFPNLFIPGAQGIRGRHRMEDEGDVVTAFALARILSNIPTSRGGPTSLVTFDIHALQRFYFGDNILPCFESGIPLLQNRLQQLPDSDNIAIAFPDDGSWKRFHKQLQHFPTIVCAKVREGSQRIVRIKEGDAQGRHVLIADDLVQLGSTLIECQKILAHHGAARISAYVTHGIFPKRLWERFECDNGGHPWKGLTYFWITDSCPLTVKEVMNRPPFEVLSLPVP